MSGGLRKEKQFSVCLHFERPVEVVQMKTTHSLWVVVTLKKSLALTGNVVNTYRC